VRVARPTLVVTLATGATPSSGGAVPEAPVGQPLVGFAVSRAIGGAVVRNRVRRRLRHLVRSRLSLLPPGSLVVVRALPASAATPSRLEPDLDAALRKAVTRSRAGRGRTAP
jgi:ribonuclease P protein component